MSVQEKILGIAKICHDTNRSYCQVMGDDSQPLWEDAPSWQQDSAISGVKFHLEKPRQINESHENWLKDKIADGWVYGEVKDPEKKTHPCMVPFDDLPWEQKFKDALFLSVVTALSPLVAEAAYREEQDYE